MTSLTLRNPLALLLSFFMALTATTFVADHAEAAPPQVRVTADVLNVRAGPGPNYRIITKARRGTLLNVINRRGGWIQVKPPRGRRSGWVSSSFVRRVR